ncbi:MAG TPA: ABC transporter ATP-binding protein [Candidatus Saccharimonadia bacterium]|jgi:ATP-binding cassette subfamily B protein
MNQSRASSRATSLALRRYVRQIWRERVTAIPGLILPGLGSIFSGYIPPLIIASILSKFGHGRPTLHDIMPYLLYFAGAWYVGELIWRLGFWCINRTDSYAMRNLYIEAMEDLSHKDIGFFHNNFAGSLTKKALGYGKSFEGFMDTLSFNIFASLIPIIFAVIILWRFTPVLVLGLLGLMAVIGLILAPLIKHRTRLVHQRETASNRMAAHVADVIGNMDAVQAFAHEDFELAQHRRRVMDFAQIARRSWDYHNERIDMFISPLYVLTNVLGLALAITFGKDAASLSAIFITFSYYVSTTRVLWEFNRIYRNLENAISEAGQFTDLLIAPPALVEQPKPIKLKLQHGEIEYRHVDFSYGAGGDMLFKNLNLHIAAGEKLAMAGRSGGGKTTITKLLLRFVDITGGELLIDGQNIAEGRLSDLRRAIAYVPQEPVMFHRSLRDNIRYGQLDATDEQVISAAKKAHAHEFITKLPEGYDTLVGERGVKLSGGQRQRIAIARAMIKDAPILVLDEATSALDSESEKLIQDALWRLMEHRTAIVIAHRLSTIQRMDRIIVLDDGRITEQGTHHQLLAHGGTYAKLWSHQSGGFIDEANS